MENIQLLFHKVDKDLVLANVFLAHNFDSAGDSSLRVETFAHFTEGAFTEDAADLIFL